MCLLLFENMMKIYTLKFLLEILAIEKKNLDNFLDRKDYFYCEFQIPKKNGMRQIQGIDKGNGKQFKELQQKFYRKVLLKQPVAAPAKGFLKGESYLSFLECHVGSKYYLRVDVRDFFGSFQEDMIKDSIGRFIEDKEAQEIAFELCTVEGKLPQGAVTSPALSNIIFARLDQRILKYCQVIEAQQRERYLNEKSWRNASLHYTRYADDMLFSSDFFDFREKLFFFHMISRILGEYGFQINREKTIMTEKEISLNGYVVGSDIRLSRKKTADLRRILYFFKDDSAERYQLDKKKLDDPVKLVKEINQFLSKTSGNTRKFSNIHRLIWYLGGCRSWIISVLRSEENVGNEVRNMKKLVRRTELLLDELSKIESKC